MMQQHILAMPPAGAAALLMAVVVLLGSACCAEPEGSTTGGSRLLKWLAVGRTLFNESLDPFDVPFGNTQRYVLDMSESAKMKKYEVRISYLGSPPAAYSMSLFRMPRNKALTSLSQVDRTAALRRKLFDTERLVFHVDELDTMPIIMEEGSAADVTDDPMMYVVEVRTFPWGRRRDGRTTLPPGEGVVWYNIKLDPILYGVPATMLPVIVVGVVVTLAVLLCALPMVLLWIRRGHEEEQPSRAVRHDEDKKLS